MITAQPASVAMPRRSKTRWAKSSSLLPDKRTYIFITALCIAVAFPALAQTPSTSTYGPIITTVAGCCENGDGNPGSEGYVGDGGPATGAELWGPSGVAVDTAGNFYIADQSNSVIRMVNVTTGVITTVAGGGNCESYYCGDGGPATAAELYYPEAVALDSAGSLYIADSFNNVIRKVTAATGIITTLAGNGTAGFGGDGGPATGAELNNPEGVAVDSTGDVYIGDYINNVVRKVTSSTGVITTVAGIPQTAGFGGDGGPATSALLNMPWGVAVDAAGNLYIADYYNNRIRKVTAAAGTINTVAGSNDPTGLYSGDGGPATSAGLNVPRGVAVDAAGNFYIADFDNSVVRKVTSPAGVITTVAGCCENTGSPGAQGYSGDGGPAASADLRNPPGVAVDLAGNLYIADSGNNVVRKVATGAITATAMTSSLNPSSGGETVTFVATVSALFGGTPTGTVTFYSGSSAIGTISIASGTARLNYSALVAGTHSITATYNGSATIAPSTSPAVSQVVNLDTTTTALATAPNPSTSGQSVTLTSTVTPGNGVAATGTVGFYYSNTLLGNAALSGGVATLNHAFTTGIYSLTAKYTGSNYKSGSTSNIVTQTVNSNKVASSTTLISSLNPSTAGTSVTFTASVTPAGPPAPTGTVTFSSNGAAITGCSAVTLTSSQTAACTSTALAVGTDSITAVYSGDTDYQASTSAPLSQAVNQAASTTALTSSLNPSAFGQLVTFTANVTGDAPTGSVAFASNGTTLSGCAAVALVSGMAQCSTATLAIGTHSIVATYSGNTNNGGSTSPALSQVVSLATTATALASNLNPSSGGQMVTFTAIVSASGGGTPTGMVTFYNGATSIGSVSLSAGAAKLNYSALTAGTHSITATYGGSSTDTTSTSAVLSQVVNLDTTTTSLATSPNPSNAGISVTMTATVTPGNGVAATGTVSFYNGSTLLGNASLSGGAATLNHLFNTAGTYNLTAKYTGSNYKGPSTSSVVTQIVEPN